MESVLIIHLCLFLLAPCLPFSFTSSKSSPFKAHYSRPKISNNALPSHLNILYESDNVIAVEKPGNISHHDDESEEGVIGFIRTLQQEGRFPYGGRIYGVHRLDRVTSGILLLAKSSQVAGSLSQSFKNKEVKKYYIALTSKKPKMKKQGWVKGDMIPSRRKSWKLTTTQNNPAITRFYTAGLGNCKLDGWYDEGSSSKSSDGIMKSLPPLPRTAILFEPHTGKTHQLRVAAKSLGLSILGDPVYSDAIESKYTQRTYLHALALHVSLGDEDIAIYNPPSSWYKNNIEPNGIEEVVHELMKKYCNNSKILSLLY